MRPIAIVTALAAAAVGFSALPAQAQDCSDAGSTVEISQCLDRELKKADAELNRVYQIALRGARDDSALPASQKGRWEAALRDAQRKWIAFRDADCRELIGYEWYGGSGMGGAMLGCLVGKTRARIKELSERYEQR